MANETKIAKAKLIEALAQIAGVPPAAFSKDRLTHANNTIEEMKRIAVEALASDDADSAKDAPINNLLEKSRAYWTAHQRYHAECQRHCIERGIKHIPAEEWNTETRTASEEMSRATHAFHALLEELFPQPENKALWEVYHAKFYGYVATVSP